MAPKVAGSSPAGHPKIPARLLRRGPPLPVETRPVGCARVAGAARHKSAIGDRGHGGAALRRQSDRDSEPHPHAGRLPTDPARVMCGPDRGPSVPRRAFQASGRPICSLRRPRRAERATVRPACSAAEPQGHGLAGPRPGPRSGQPVPRRNDRATVWPGSSPATSCGTGRGARDSGRTAASTAAAVRGRASAEADVCLLAVEREVEAVRLGGVGHPHRRDAVDQPQHPVREHERPH